MNYDNAFNNFAKALKQGFAPEDIANPLSVEHDKLGSPSYSETLAVGTIANRPSSLLLDTREHFPVITQNQARSSMTRVMQLSDVPVWYNGTLAQLRQEVYRGIIELHPGIEFNVRVPAELAVGLSDGQTAPETSKNEITDPSDRVKNQVPEIERPSMTSAQVENALQNDNARKVVAGHLTEVIDQQMKALQLARKVASRISESGLTAEDFEKLGSYLQEDILSALLSRGTTAALEDRRKQALDRINKRHEQS